MSAFDTATKTLKETREAVTDATQEKAVETGAQMRDRVAEEGDQIADAAHAAAAELGDNEQLGQLLSQAGQAVEGLTTQLKDTPVTQMVDDVAVFAKRNPLLFLGGAALAGFAAARFLKASTPQSHTDEIDPWSGHLSAGAAETEGK